MRALRMGLVALAVAASGRKVCLPKKGAAKEKLQSALDYACNPSQGATNCTAVESGGVCFTPNTLVDHCRYVFNAYYVDHAARGGTCDFGGAAELVTCATEAETCDPCPPATPAPATPAPTHTPAPTPPDTARCSAFHDCSKLSGDCCPTAGGTCLQCCFTSGVPAPAACGTPAPKPAPTPAPTPTPPTPQPTQAPPLPPAQATVPSRFLGFLHRNVAEDSGRVMPLSYKIPPGYFEGVPDNQRPHDNEDRNASQSVDFCGGVVDGAALDRYEYQSEQLLTRYGLNIYDGAVWCIAKAVMGDVATPRRYLESVLRAGRTAGLQTIRASKPCQDLAPPLGNCTGDCGFCYGDHRSAWSQSPDHAYFFRSISQTPASPYPDERCPNAGVRWTWNDWKPILGENAWANLLGSLTVAYVGAGQSYWDVDMEGVELSLATDIVTALMAMRVGDTGAVYYAPHNTVVGGNANSGSTVSTENQASLLAGLKALRWLIKERTTTDADSLALLGDVDELISGVKHYLVSAFKTGSDAPFFRQGGTYDNATGVFTWAQGAGIPEFAVDCQTWVGTVLGPQFMDERLGKGASLKLWRTTKSIAGYGVQGNGSVRGVGYTTGHSVFSGEWTLGAVNWLRTVARAGSYTAAEAALMEREADFMLQAIHEELVRDSSDARDGSQPAVLYANVRYRIPFGWWSNPIPSLCSTGWMVAVQKSWNPFMITGAYDAEYPEPGPRPSSDDPVYSKAWFIAVCVVVGVGLVAAAAFVCWRMRRRGQGGDVDRRGLLNSGESPVAVAS